jgi:predicted O-methyltransferase YrrM
MYLEEISGKTYRSEDGNATEEEVRQFIKGLCVLMQPDRVLETGCYKGGLTAVIADAIPQHSILYTCDTDSEMVAETEKTLLPIQKMVIVFGWPGIALIEYLSREERPIDLAILDSGGNRIEEAEAVEKIMRPGGIILIHDTRRQDEAAAIEILRLRDYTEIFFETPRGLSMLQSPRSD